MNTHMRNFGDQKDKERFSLVIDFIFEKWCREGMVIEPDDVTDEMLLKQYGDCVRNMLLHNRLNGNKDNNDDLEYKIKDSLDRWDRQISEIYLESKLRNNRKCVIFNVDDSFGILNRIENECKISDLSIGKYDNFDIKSYLKQIEKYDIQIKNVKNKLKVINANIENRQIGTQERNKINEIKIKKSEIDVENARIFLMNKRTKKKTN